MTRKGVVVQPIPRRPNAHTTGYKGNLETEYSEDNEATGRYRWNNGPWQRKEPVKWWQFWRWFEGDYP